MSDANSESPLSAPSDSGTGAIFSPKDYYRLTYDGRRIRCYLRLEDPARFAGTPPTAGVLKATILEDCEHRGILAPHARTIQSTLKNQDYGTDILIAEGREPVAGRDGVIRYEFRTDLDEIRLKEDDAGRVDFRELGLIQNVEPRDVLAVATKPTPGRPGLDVFGQPVRAVPGQAARMRGNEHVEISEDGFTAKSAIDGCVQLENLVICVAPVFLVRGDVNFRGGNVKFNGTVRVQGSVLEDFSVAAKGDVLIDGDIEKANVTAGGKIYVRGSVLGKEGVCVRAGQDIFSRIVVNATLEAGRDVHIADELVNSHVVAGGSLRLDGAERRIMGGSVTAYTEVRAGTIGSETGLAKTRIELRLQPGLLEEAAEHDERHAHIDLQCAQREGALAKLLAFKEKMGRLTSEQYRQVRTLMKEVQDLRDEQSQCARKANALRQTHADQLDASVRVEQTCYPGTTIVIHSTEYPVNHETGRCAFSLRDECLAPREF